MGQFHTQRKENLLALEYFKLALITRNSAENLFDHYLYYGSALHQLGDLYLQMDSLEQVENYLRKGLEHRKKVYPNQKSSNICISYLRLAYLASRNNSIDLSLNYLDSALTSINFSSINSLQEVTSILHLLAVYRDRGTYLNQRYNKTREERILRLADKTHTDALRIFTYLQTTYPKTDSQIQSASRSYFVYKNAMFTKNELRSYEPAFAVVLSNV